MSDPIDLNKARKERERREGQKLHDLGKAFAFRPWHFQPEGTAGDFVGFVEPEPCPCGDPLEVVVMLEDLSGIIMSRKDARLLAEALLEACASAEAGPPTEET